MQSQSNQIKAIGHIKPGEPKDFTVLHYERKPLGPRDILVKIHAVSVNPIDGKKRKSGYAEPEPNNEKNPLVVGYDASGVVIEVGSDVKYYKVGDEVFYLGDVRKKGTNASEHVVDERIVGPKPKSLTHAQAAAIPLVFATAWEGLTAQLKISEDPEKNKGKTMLVVAGAGGLGSAAIQLAKKVLGFTVIATASREDSIEYCKKMGADIVINHRNPLAEELKKQGLDGVNYIFNCYDMIPNYFHQFAEIVLPFGGILGITGFLEPMSLFHLFRKNAFASTEYVFTRSTFGIDMDLQREDLIKISKWLDEGRIEHNMTIQEDFTLENLIKAHEKIESATMIGKYVLANVDKF
mmetsp:Transcript_62969/g.73289  ORF Transcript_62969/g.73289 Transcript_62969/m.73289 type:complete len:351 (+) Transcript_62969:24-1076(+)